VANGEGGEGQGMFVLGYMGGRGLGYGGKGREEGVGGWVGKEYGVEGDVVEDANLFALLGIAGDCEGEGGIWKDGRVG